MHEYAQVHILSLEQKNLDDNHNSKTNGDIKETYVEQLLRGEVSLLDSVQRYRIVEIERKAFRLWWFKLWNTEGVSIFIISVHGTCWGGKNKLVKCLIVDCTLVNLHTFSFVQFNF